MTRLPTLRRTEHAMLRCGNCGPAPGRGKERTTHPNGTAGPAGQPEATAAADVGRGMLREVGSNP